MKNNVCQAAVVIARCQETKKPYGIRFEKKNDGWHATWTFKINENQLGKEKYDEINITGDGFFVDKTYPGCPYCKSKIWFTCGNCNEITCNDTIHEKVTCAWCGNVGLLHTVKDGIKFKGGAM